jgi:hypothetical protein
MIARIINTPQFCLITLSKEDGSEIVSSWSDIYTLIEKVKGVAKVRDIPFYEVYPIKTN